ncbi:uncharacterized protein LOC132894700 [Neoarius graeffei]|uniref:uncharacterized protein LOC132894700 n=1 Tax=Neoarius graeffei TaxID=443677 RepID=UPI00298D5398|nr:uncharacterized protein LOC132894700 [Neoarius graeffei]
MANANQQQPEIKINIQERQNSRLKDERYISGKHVSVRRLRELIQTTDPKNPMTRYIIKEIPPYPTPVEFWVSDVAHVTDKSGVMGILESEQFMAPESEFSWWGLKINKEEIRAAEERYMEGKSELNEQKPFLEKFTTSPSFQPEKSRYGNYRFTFPLTDLMQWYKEQNCGGEEPVLRVYKTVTYKQEIMYVLLIHSPEDNERFGGYPLLEASEWVRYQDGKITWKAQAICETHWYQFVSGEVQRLYSKEFYVWDQVSLVFHLPKDIKPHKVLKIPRERLIEALEECDLDKINLSRNKGPKDNEKERQECFLEAERKINIQEQQNSRLIDERYISGKHVSVRRLRELIKTTDPKNPMKRYIIKEIPPYPTPVEFWVSDVAHVTDESGFKGILESEQFRAPESEFSW